MLLAIGATIAPRSLIVTREFCSNFPVVVSNLAIALSVAVAGPITSPLPLPPPPIALITPLLITTVVPSTLTPPRILVLAVGKL